MREIRFRAWDKASQSIRYGAEHSLTMCLMNPDTFELMQYTGLKDKNGKENYHSDLCKDGWDNTWRIDWSDEYAGFELTLVKAGILGEIPKLNICRVIDMENIGNIYENPGEAR